MDHHVGRVVALRVAIARHVGSFVEHRDPVSTGESELAGEHCAGKSCPGDGDILSRSWHCLVVDCVEVAVER
jgi:hypothetical protein